MSFIWDAAENSGYVLCQALQGYAPIIAEIPVTNANFQAETNPAFENINGCPCRKTEALVALANGSTEKYRVWRAADGKRFPVRIESASGSFRIDFFDIRPRSFEHDLFLPPPAFTRYSHSEAMAAELVLRTAAMRKPIEGNLLSPSAQGFEQVPSVGHNPAPMR
jgi:hypothetical protein